MDNLWIFGDSFSAPFSNPEVGGFGIPYMQYKGYEPNIFADTLSERLNLNHINKAYGGCDNYTIFESICNNVNDIGDEDIIIVGWSSKNRFRLLDDSKDEWMIILPGISTNQSLLKFNTDFFKIQNVVRDESELITKELASWMSLLKKMFGERILFWSPFTIDNENIISPTGLITIGDIKKDTDNHVVDGHWDEKTHSEFANLLITLIDKNPKKLI